jgi:hypothetical protein
MSRPIPPDKSQGTQGGQLEFMPVPPPPEHIHRLADPDPDLRAQVAWDLFRHGAGRALHWFDKWQKDEEFRGLIVREQFVRLVGGEVSFPKMTVGIAVLPDTFEKIRAAYGFPPLADAPSDMDVLEFEIEHRGRFVPSPRLDIITTKAPGGGGVIARFLEKFGEGIQQVELCVTDVDLATKILRERFQFDPVYPETRLGANGRRINFLLVTAWNGGKVLIELVEQPNKTF